MYRQLRRRLALFSRSCPMNFARVQLRPLLMSPHEEHSDQNQIQNNTAPPTPAPIPTALLLLFSGATVGLLAAPLPVGVGPVNDRALLANELDTTTDDEVTTTLVDAPTAAAFNVNTALSVLQHLSLSASLSQQNLASLANHSLPHCHTCTPAARKS